MPYLKPIEMAARQAVLLNGTIAATLFHVAESGYLHNDIKWRHFGYFGKMLYMCDMGDVKDIPTAFDEDGWVMSSMATLMEAANLQIDWNVLSAAIVKGKAKRANEALQKSKKRKRSDLGMTLRKRSKVSYT